MRLAVVPLLSQPQSCSLQCAGPNTVRRSPPSIHSRTCSGWPARAVITVPQCTTAPGRGTWPPCPVQTRPSRTCGSRPTAALSHWSGTRPRDTIFNCQQACISGLTAVRSLDVDADGAGASPTGPVMPEQSAVLLAAIVSVSDRISCMEFSSDSELLATVTWRGDVAVFARTESRDFAFGPDLLLRGSIRAALHSRTRRRCGSTPAPSSCRHSRNSPGRTRGLAAMRACRSVEARQELVVAINTPDNKTALLVKRSAADFARKHELMLDQPVLALQASGGAVAAVSRHALQVVTL